MNLGIGKKVKQLRLAKNLTLKDISQKTSLSVAFLSQFERGQSLITVDKLAEVAAALDVDLTYFIGTPKSSGAPIVHVHERQVDLADESYIHYNLSNIEDKSHFLPRFITLMPSTCEDNGTPAYPHEGEEFILVLKGVLNLWVDHVEYQLNAGDCAHFDSALPHKWVNKTSSNVDLLAINTINFYSQGSQSASYT